MYDLVFAEKRMKRDSGMRSVVQRLIKSSTKTAAAAESRQLITTPPQIDGVASLSRSQHVDSESHKIRPDSRPESAHMKTDVRDVSGARGGAAGGDKHVSESDKDRRTWHGAAHQRGLDNQFQFESDKDIALYNDLIAALVGWDSPDWRNQLLR
jgi:hypothetical protein